VDLSQVAEADIRKALDDQISTLESVEGTQSDFTHIEEKRKRKPSSSKDLDVH
jgi:hypothetical protein